MGDKHSKTILIIGANGFLGSTILQLRKTKEISDLNYQFLAGDINNSNIPIDVTFYHINITDHQDILKKIEFLSPNVIILTAAMTNVDQNELDKDRATAINTGGPKNILEACKKTGSKLVFMSTDFVFDGISKEGNYNENDTPNPLSYYAKTKYEAEQAIIKSDIEYTICRTAVLYGWNKEKQNFITWIISKLQQNEPIKIVTDQFNSPTFVRNLAEIIMKLIEKDARGIYHTAGDCTLNRYEMALKCAEVFNLKKELISSIDSFEQIAIRPKNAGLDMSKLKRFLGSDFKIYDLNDGLNHMKDHSL